MLRSCVLMLVVLTLLAASAGVASAQRYGENYSCPSSPEYRAFYGQRPWREYTAQERRMFPDYYYGYRRYFGGFHANYYRDFPGNNSGLTNGRDGYGLGWAW